MNRTFVGKENVYRPRTSEKRDVSFRMCMTRSEKQEIERLANELDITQTELIFRGLALVMAQHEQSFENLEEVKSGFYGI